MLACATLIEVYYLMLLLDYSSKAYKSHQQNEDGEGKREFKRFLDSAFDIYLRCDPVSLSASSAQNICNDVPIGAVHILYTKHHRPLFILFVS